MRRLLHAWALAALPMALPMAASLIACPLAAQQVAPRPLSSPAGARLGADTLRLKVPPVLGPFGAATALRPDPARLADRVVAVARRRHDQRIGSQWARTVAAGLAVPLGGLERLHEATVSATA